MTWIGHTCQTCLIQKLSCHKNKLLWQLLGVNKNTSWDLINIKVAHLGDNKNHTIIFKRLHQDRIVILDLRRKLNLNLTLMLIFSRSRVSYLYKVDFLNFRISCLLLTETENIALLLSFIINLQINEASSETFNDLRLFLFNIE